MDLSGFDPSTMNYLATQQLHPHVAGNGDPFQDMLLPTEYVDQQSTYGGYAGYVELRKPGQECDLTRQTASVPAY